MNGTRLATLVASLVCALLIGSVGTASAQTATTPMAKKIPITGVAKNGKKLKNGTFAIQKFTKRNGKLYADGVVRGTFKGKSVKRQVSVPVRNTSVASGAQSSQLPPLPPGPSCNILSLDLGPINLNLLGLVVRTNVIQVRIDAVQGPGNLLGNLLCGITNALNPGGLTGTLTQIQNILNALLALAPRTA
jgi:hypothetical protein